MAIPTFNSSSVLMWYPRWLLLQSSPCTPELIRLIRKYIILWSFCTDFYNCHGGMFSHISSCYSLFLCLSLSFCVCFLIKYMQPLQEFAIATINSNSTNPQDFCATLQLCPIIATFLQIWPTLYTCQHYKLLS